MKKYEPLADHLRESLQVALPMTFDEIERVLGAKLPPSAFKERSWWSNNLANRVATYAWLGAGCQTANVDIPGRKLVFQKAVPEESSPRTDGSQQAQKEPRLPGADTCAGFYPNIFGALKGTVSIPAGTDLT